jgi:predicted nucleic acid-binding protein
MTSAEKTAVVLDTTVLSNYAISESVTWLTDSNERLWTVPAVRTELERGIELGYDGLAPAVRAISEGEINVDTDAPDRLGETYMSIRTTIDRGEAEALVAALESDGAAALATDDQAARDVAREYDTAVTGSLGLLADGVTTGEISIETADSWLDSWKTDGNYIAPVDSITEVLSSGNDSS